MSTKAKEKAKLFMPGKKKGLSKSKYDSKKAFDPM